MTAERDGKSRRTGQPDLLASLPDERQAPDIDPAVIEELLTRMRDLGEQVAGLKEAVSAERPAPVTLDDLREEVAGLREAESAERPAPVTLEALEAWGDKLVARVAEAARTADAPGNDAAAKAAAAAERIDGGLESTVNRVVAEVGVAATRIEAGFRITRDHVDRQSRLVHGALEDIRTHTAGRRFGWRTVFVWLIVFVAGMFLESHRHILYNWLWAG